MRHTCAAFGILLGGRQASVNSALLLAAMSSINSAGCEDGSVTVWDLRTRQPIRTLQKAGKGPVTGLLVMDRPAFLAAGQGGRGDRSNNSAQNSTSSKGPQRPQPLAPFGKYYGIAEGLKPWEGVSVVIDGSMPYRYCSAQVEPGSKGVMGCICYMLSSMCPSRSKPSVLKRFVHADSA